MGSLHLKAGTSEAGLILGSLDPVDLATLPAVFKAPQAEVGDGGLLGSGWGLPCMVQGYVRSLNESPSRGNTQQAQAMKSV